MTTSAVSVEHVSKEFRVYKERNNTLKSAIMRRNRSSYQEFQALKDVSLDIPQGSTFALVGDNGSGKSTLLKCMARILVPDEGSIRAHGRVAAMLEVGSGFHPELSGRDNIYLNGSILGMSRREIDKKLDDIIAFSGVEDFIDQPVKNYSSGMYVRLGFSVAINTEPDILLVDEILAVGDASFQEKCAKKFDELKAEGRTIVVVSHSIAQLRAMADTAAYLDHGALQEVGPSTTVLEKYADAARENIRIDDDGRVRWGTAEATVRSVEVLGEDGAPLTSSARTGSALVLRLHFEAPSALVRPRVGLAMSTGVGAHLWSSFTNDAGSPIERMEGEGHIDLRVPDLPLQPGRYPVDGAIISADGESVIDYVRQIAVLEVALGGPKESGGPVALRGTWGDVEVAR